MQNHRHTALVVDDYVDSRDALVVLIESSGFRAVGAGSGAEALTLLNNGLGCCLIVLDWWLRDMTGAEFLRKLQAHSELRSIPVAVWSADAAVRALAIELGASCALLKPADPEQFLDLVNEHCSKAKAPAVA